MNGGGPSNLTSKHGGSMGAGATAWSQPTSPTPVNRGNNPQLNGPMSPTGGGLVVGQKLVYASMVPQIGKKNDDGEWAEEEETFKEGS